LLFEDEAHVTVALFPGHFPSKPGRRLESATARTIGKFHLGNYKTGMSAPINIDLNQQIFARNFVAHFSQSSPGRTRPERCELLLAQFDLAFFAMAAPTDLKREGRSAASLSQADLSTSRLGRQITLLDKKASRPLQIVRQPFDQKFSLNFAIVSRSIRPSHKVNILSAIHVVSRFSRTREIDDWFLKS
jgi:hypothetical protein